MILLHRRAPFMFLGEYGTYGFDTTSIDLFAGGSLATLPGSLRTPGTLRTVESICDEIAGVDATFADTFDLVLELSDGFMAGTAQGSVVHQDYVSPGHAVYAQIMDTVDGVISEYGNRVKAIRWNHEFRPTFWDRGTAWWTWAFAQNYSLANSVYTTYLDNWNYMLQQVFLGSLPSRDVYFNCYAAATGTWATAAFDGAKALYGSYFCDYHCRIEASIVNNFVGSLPTGRVFLAYGGMVGPEDFATVPSVHGPSELSLDWRLSDATSLVWQIGSYDTNQSGVSWLAGMASNSGTRNFFFAMQQDLTNWVSCEAVPTYVYRRRAATNAAGGPWDDSFAWWSPWYGPATGTPGTSYEEQYLDALGYALTS